MILFLWLKGLGCVVCCTSEVIKPLFHVNAAVTRTSASETQVNLSENGCHESDCCRQPVKKPSKAESNPVTGESAPLQLTTSGELKVCSLLASQTLGFTVSSKSIKSLVIDDPGSISADFTSTSRANNFYFAQPLELRNRSGTYLRCCALLI